MNLQHGLAVDLVTLHPDEAASIIEDLTPEEAAGFLDGLPVEAVAGVLLRTTAQPAGAVLAHLDGDIATKVVEKLPSDVAATYLRRVEPSARERILSRLDEGPLRSMRAMLQFPEDSAAALMDPAVLALPAERSVAEAIDLVRRSAEHARYNLYVVDRDDRLVGVLNLRELMLAEPEQRLEQIMRRDVIRLEADTHVNAVIQHPGWQQVHALPVSDANGVYLGAVRYGTLRRLEREREAPDRPGDETARALADLFQAGISGVVETLAGAATPKGSGS